jgi:hypothetical protein
MSEVATTKGVCFMAKVRSPNYPTLSFRDAVTRVESIYKKEHRHPADRLVIAQALGYGTVNGASMSAISALIKYGLLESAPNDQFRISDRGQDICIYDQGNPHRALAVKESAFRPALYKELYETYGDHLPTDANLRSYLLKKQFNPNSVAAIIRSYRDTIEFVGEETLGVDIEVEDDDWNDSIGTKTGTPVRNLSQRTEGPIDRDESFIGISKSSSAPPTSSNDRLILGFNLSVDSKVQAIFDGKVTQEAIRKFIQLLELSIDTFPPKDSLTPSPNTPSPNITEVDVESS